MRRRLRAGTSRSRGRRTPASVCCALSCARGRRRPITPCSPIPRPTDIASASSGASDSAFVGWRTLSVLHTWRTPARRRSATASPTKRPWTTSASTVRAPCSRHWRAATASVVPVLAMSSTRTTARPASRSDGMSMATLRSPLRVLWHTTVSKRCPRAAAASHCADSSSGPTRTASGSRCCMKSPKSAAAERATADSAGTASASVATRCRCGSTVTTASKWSASNRPTILWLIASPGLNSMSCRM